MVRLLGFAEPLMRGGVTGIFLKGSHAPREIEEARARWRFEASVLPSQSGEGGNIVKVEKMSRV
jgi:16S rRNA (guanine527-N7)-methyltransferase